MTKSKFEEIYRDLKYHVEQGDYLYSELLPSENNLIGIYDCSRNSIRRNIAGLVKDGYVQAVHGKGVQVIFQPSEKTNFIVGGIESFQETAARNRMTYCTKVVVYETITVDESLSRELIFMDSYNCLAVVTSNTFNSDGVMFEYTQSLHQPEYFSFHDTATRKKAAT